MVNNLNSIQTSHILHTALIPLSLHFFWSVLGIKIEYHVVGDTITVLWQMMYSITDWFIHLLILSTVYEHDSVFTYCPTTWHYCSKKVEKIMENIYERGLRFVMNDPSRSYEELLMLTKYDTMFYGG